MSLDVLVAPGLARLDHVVHGFTTREGGYSSGAYASLNLGLRLGDDRATVEQNRGAVLARLNRPDATWVSLKQVHGSSVVEVTHRAGGSIEADALWTRDPKVAIAVLVADCVPILLADRRGRVIAAVHAGWRGSVARIVEAMVKRLDGSGVPPSELLAAIGPAIGPCCYEVGEEVAAQLRTSAAPDGDVVSRREDGRLFADLWEHNRGVLIASGVPAASIDTFRQCTRCNRVFYSYRRDQPATGRQAAVIAFAHA